MTCLVYSYKLYVGRTMGFTWFEYGFDALYNVFMYCHIWLNKVLHVALCRLMKTFEVHGLTRAVARQP